MIQPKSQASFALVLMLGAQAVFSQSGFTLYNATYLDITLGSGCINALAARITCDSYVQNFTELEYRGSLQDTALTDSVCTSACSTSLKVYFNDVTTRCNGKTLDDSVPNRLGGYLWAGYNETCVKYINPKRYCNDIIANFTTVADYKKMPRDEHCHASHIRRIALMQSSPYSIYDGYYKELLTHIYSQYPGAKGPTDIPPPLIKLLPIEAPYCISGKRYTTKKGDTCETIANATSVSSAAVYTGNQDLVPNCLDIDPGISVCVPLPCATYRLKPTDTCASVEVSLSFEPGRLRRYNDHLNYDCSNLQTATSFWGRILCVSPQGGTYTAVPRPLAGPPNDAPLADGYTRTAIPPPADAKVAPGTTLLCGKWHVVSAGRDTCSRICVQAGIEASLFRRVNPSLAGLAGEACTRALRVQSALCVGPTYSWNMTASASESS
ncbi:hypothetical protein CNYM01_08974 [Colletotrichum nymphaeae SA-01]|uniref:LysM domain-containing protein n=1 Tax=Colletotrichum nymphaeae SA-01 TaxID=1460502 RepID=A0A135UYC5_9PEZI|nr:hypothetical protein CNYM01_08974 [Colletotrichum nymphaeae SA-01]